MLKKEWKIEVPAEFLYDNDYYLIEGKKYLRVTRVKSIINQPGLNNWRASVGSKAANKIMRERGTFGSNFHKLAELIVTDKAVSSKNYNEEMQECLKMFSKFVKECNLIVEAIEQHLWYGDIGGTTDFIGYADLPEMGLNAHVIGDWKTSAKVYDNYWIQLATYVVMFEKMTGIKLDGAFILHLRNGKATVHEKTYEELLWYYGLFENCVPLYKNSIGEFKWKGT